MPAEAKIKKKIFVRILAPKLFQEQLIGETPVTESRLLLGRKMSVNMMSLTNDPKDQNIQLKLSINTLQGADAVSTELLGLTLSPAFVRRLVRKEKSRVDDCFTVKTADNKNVVVKTFLLTINIVTNSILTSLRKKSYELAKNAAAQISSEAFISEVLSHKFQEKLRKDLNKIYPLKQCEVKDLHIVSESKKSEEKEVVVNAQASN
jgi:small subunit ribosomal protein S3Ae